jgi:hypothetical protein
MEGGDNDTTCFILVWWSINEKTPILNYTALCLIGLRLSEGCYPSHKRIIVWGSSNFLTEGFDQYKS